MHLPPDPISRHFRGGEAQSLLSLARRRGWSVAFYPGRRAVRSLALDCREKSLRARRISTVISPSHMNRNCTAVPFAAPGNPPTIAQRHGNVKFFGNGLPVRRWSHTHAKRGVLAHTFSPPPLCWAPGGCHHRSRLGKTDVSTRCRIYPPRWDPRPCPRGRSPRQLKYASTETSAWSTRFAERSIRYRACRPGDQQSVKVGAAPVTKVYHGWSDNTVRSQDREGLAHKHNDAHGFSNEWLTFSANNIDLDRGSKKMKNLVVLERSRG